MHYPRDRIAHTTSFGVLVRAGMKKYLSGSTMKDRSDDPSHHSRLSTMGQLWSTGWKEKQLSGSTMRDRSKDLMFHKHDGFST